jgi:hypothetical protein
VDNTDDARAQAIDRIRARRGLMKQMWVYVAISAFLVLIWLVAEINSDQSVFFWPIIPIAGMAIALVVVWWQQRPGRIITEEEIQREIARSR